MAHTDNVDIPPLRWLDPPVGPAIELLDQTRLPATESVLTCRDVPTLVDAISRLAVRGAPMLGLAGAYGVALAAHLARSADDVAAAADVISRTRPTAINLGWGARRALAAYLRAWSDSRPYPERIAASAALAEARAIEAQDAAASRAIAEAGLALVPPHARVLTHCNTGALVSAGEGTAFAVILAAHRAGRLTRLWVDETRPLLQGARLTTYEAQRAGLPYALLADSAAASLMAAGQVDMVLIGADRIAADGSVANKVGSYSLAVLAHHHRVPFVVAAPVSTIDFAAAGAAAMVVEHRGGEEVTGFAGTTVAVQSSPAYNPAFDVTPPSLVSALITERGVAQPVNAGNLRVLRDGCDLSGDRNKIGADPLATASVER